MNEKVRGVQILADLSEKLQTRPPLSYRNLSLVPLAGLNRSLSYLLASEALEQGLLTVREVSSAGQVPSLIRKTPASLPIRRAFRTGLMVQSVIYLALFPNDGHEHSQGRMMPPAFRRSWHMR